MKVVDLIKLLAQQDPNLEVEAEGCDCLNDVTGVIVRDGSERKKVLIRTNGGGYYGDN